MGWRRTAHEVDSSMSWFRAAMSALMLLVFLVLTLVLCNSDVEWLGYLTTPAVIACAWGMWRNLTKSNYYTPDDWEDQ